ncbi:rRNA/tRNA 2'-O-methyltransferase fibrillarin-like protein 1 isoform X1 [Triticum urartu]|uniref:Uncharacterized protein n=1 Tax=Triticum urartu TaxID=4572 RepID=A0A8R7JY09_TRIUA|nr:rRNA/tRNA 2'-O-methyltransferase fibrillarin-like protein 1 isoform X1 [Triticum urartu]XP_048566113.1 rRNA/tRNA 2'-O-methyltransferase fibrillarin-like protein 1 isoform X1 [Triticum urartu]
MPSSSSMFISSWIAACSEVGAMELGAPPAGPGACSGPEVSGDLQYLEVKMARPWEGGGNLQQGAGLGMTRWGICWPRKLGRMGGDPLGEMGGDGGGGGGSGGGGRRRRGRWRWRIQRWGATEAGGSGRRPGWRRGENSKLKGNLAISLLFHLVGKNPSVMYFGTEGVNSK